jgi:hypothetical protein
MKVVIAYIEAQPTRKKKPSVISAQGRGTYYYYEAPLKHTQSGSV